MGRGRQKAKQQKIARKLKYLTTDTDYAELAKELSSQEQDSDAAQQAEGTEGTHQAKRFQQSQVAQAVTSSTVRNHDDAPAEDDLDEYAKWAAEAAAKATSGELPIIKPTHHALPTRHKPIPMPIPSALKAKKH